MTTRSCRIRATGLNAKIVVAAVKGEDTTELAQLFNVHPELSPRATFSFRTMAVMSLNPGLMDENEFLGVEVSSTSERIRLLCTSMRSDQRSPPRLYEARLPVSSCL